MMGFDRIAGMPVCAVTFTRTFMVSDM
jgi:hypothetical protein